jgi:nucleotide-binding universal stress UspA family protein
MTFDRILIGIDGSESAQAAARWAVDLGGQLGARVLAVHGFPRHPMLSGDTNDDLYAEEQREFADEWCKPLEEGGVDYQLIMEVGDPRDLLLSVAVREHADMIVVGNRGRSPVVELMLGSVAGYVSHHAPVPVVIVRS